MDTHPALHTTAKVAAELGLAPRTVQALAAARRVGTMYGNQRLYTSADVDKLRERAPRGNHSGKSRRRKENARVLQDRPANP